MKVSVTAEDISIGVRYRSCLCPVALAMTRASGKQVIVWLHQWSYEGVYPSFSDLPREVVGWIMRFDKGEKVEPMEFST